MALERYRIEALLSRGETQEVHRAFDTRLRRTVALKLVRGDGRGDGNTGLLREARAAAALRHPNVVIIYDVGEDNGTAYIAMEMLDGHRLRHYRDAPDVELSRKLGWLRDVAAALAAAHAIGLVHRDVNLDNVMVTRADIAKLLDFGIARTVSPEDGSATRSAVSPVSDQQSWALVAVELVTGQALASPALASEALRAVGVDASVAAAIARALEPAEAQWPSIAAIIDVFDAAGLSAAPLISEVELRPTLDTAGLEPPHGATSASPTRLGNLVPRRLRSWFRAPRGRSIDRSSLVTSLEPTAEVRRAGVVRRRPTTPPVPRPRSRVRRWLVACGVALVGGVVARLAIGAWSRAPSPSPSCEIAAEVAIAGAGGTAPLDLVACEGKILVTMNGAHARSALGPIDGPLVMSAIQLPDAQFAIPLCRSPGRPAIVAWREDRGAVRLPTEFIVGPADPREPPEIMSSSELRRLAPCVAAEHPGGNPLFVACEHDKPDDPNLIVRFEGPLSVEVLVRGDETSAAKPHAIAAGYPLADRPFVAYRVADRLAGIFPSPFLVANQTRVELARGRLGDPAVATRDDRMLVVWPQDDGGGHVLRGAWVTQGQPPQRAATGDPRSTAAAAAVDVMADGIVIAWVADATTGALEVGYGADVADAVARARVVAVNASQPRLAVNGAVVVASWRETTGAPRVVRLACRRR